MLDFTTGNYRKHQLLFSDVITQMLHLGNIYLIYHHFNPSLAIPLKFNNSPLKNDGWKTIFS